MVIQRLLLIIVLATGFPAVYGADKNPKKDGREALVSQMNELDRKMSEINRILSLTDPEEVERQACMFASAPDSALFAASRASSTRSKKKNNKKKNKIAQSAAQSYNAERNYERELAIRMGDACINEAVAQGIVPPGFSVDNNVACIEMPLAAVPEHNPAEQSIFEEWNGLHHPTTPPAKSALQAAQLAAPALAEPSQVPVEHVPKTTLKRETQVVQHDAVASSTPVGEEEQKILQELVTSIEKNSSFSQEQLRMFNKKLAKVKDINTFCCYSNDYKWTLLQIAADSGSNAVVNCLLARNADPNRADRNRPLPLYQAAHNGHVGVVSALITHKANVNGRCGEHQNTALMMAACKNQIPVIELLMKSPTLGGDAVDKDAGDVGGHTALHYAVKTNSYGAIQALLAHKVDVNKANCAGTTPLMLAALNGNIDAVKLLLAAGADVMATDSRENIAFSYALKAPQHGKEIHALLDAELKKQHPSVVLNMQSAPTKGIGKSKLSKEQFFINALTAPGKNHLCAVVKKLLEKDPSLIKCLDDLDKAVLKRCCFTCRNAVSATNNIRLNNGIKNVLQEASNRKTCVQAR